MAYKVVGNTIVEWNDDEPFVFKMTEEVGPKGDRRNNTLELDLSALRLGVEDDFLLNLKEHLIERRNKIALVTVKTEHKHLTSLLRKVIDHGILDKKISTIDETFLLSLNTIKEKLSKPEVKYLRMTFRATPYSPMFAPDLQIVDFPQESLKKGMHGSQIDRILAKALTRSACVDILTRCEQAYDKDEMDIGHFSFVNLAFSVFCRPESYRQIKLDDLVLDTSNDSFFIYIPPVKTGVHQSNKLCYKINQPVGVLLQKQRQHVISTYGHMVDPADIGKLALFPSRKLSANKSSWMASHSNKNFGECISAEGFTGSYNRQIQKRFLNDAQLKINANSLRHTVGTQLAQSGCSAKTIMAVLKHATDIVCTAYVDIAFHGLIKELSDAIRPAFEAHMPVFETFRSKSEVTLADKAIHSDDQETGRTELTGECGKQIQCEHAPITCYGCHRFIPCVDADHSMNLDIVQREIDRLKKSGKPYEQLVKRAQTSKYEIFIVMNACDRHRQAMANQEVRS